MARKACSLALASLILGTLACGLPAPAAEPTAPLADSVLPTPSAEPAPPLPVSLSQAVSGGVEAGSWTESEGIIRSLRYLAGELSAEEVFGNQPLMSSEGTLVVRRAQVYLKDPANTDGRDELTRLLAILVPSRETLDRFSKPAAASLGGGGLARPPNRPIGDEVLCRALWSTGFELVENARGEMEEPVCLEVHEIGLGGRAHRIYLPAYWEADAPERRLLEPTLEALQRSLETYNPYGPEAVAGTDIVFTDLPMRVGTRVRGDVLAAADERLIDTAGDRAGDLRCHVAVFPVAVDLAVAGEGSAEGGGESYGAFRQTIAHELFHCYQMTNLGLLPRPLAPAGSVGGDPTEWWVEGSAEYFASVVYPSVNAEFDYLDDLDSVSPNSSLITYSYPAYAFFEYLDAQGGMTPEGVVDGILRELPVAGSFDDQQAAVAGLPGMADAFHEFGRSYLDKQLQDLGGGVVPLHPQPGESASFGVGPGEAHFTLDPFVLHRYRLSFADHTRFTVTQQTEGVNRNAARPASAPGAWSEMPPEVNTDCGDSEYVLLATSVVPPGAEAVTVDINTRGRQLEEDQPCDECVVGSWVLDNGSYLAHLGGLMPIVQGGLGAFGLSTEGAESYPTGVTGVMTMTFDGEGIVKGEQVDWGIAAKAVKDDDVVTLQVVYNGAGEATWRIETDETTDTDYLFFDNRSFALSGRAIFQGFPLSAPLPTSDSNDPIFLSSPQPFLCNATTLTYYSYDPVGPVVFFRTESESSDP